MESKDKAFAGLFLLMVAVIMGLLIFFSIGGDKTIPEENNVEVSEVKEEMRTEFMEGCTESGDATYTYCNCVFEDLYKILGAERFKREAVEYALNEKFSKEMLDLAIDSAIKCTK